MVSKPLPSQPQVILSPTVALPHGMSHWFDCALSTWYYMHVHMQCVNTWIILHKLLMYTDKLSSIREVMIDSALCKSVRAHIGIICILLMPDSICEHYSNTECQHQPHTCKVAAQLPIMAALSIIGTCIQPASWILCHLLHCSHSLTIRWYCCKLKTS